VFGDGSLVALPTPGHTPGSVSLLVRRSGHPPLLLVGDLTYDIDHMERGEVPGSGNQPEMRRSTQLIAQLKQRMPDLVVLAAHDPSASRRLRASLQNARPAES
jgi:N-acyl homoserine lactone hydrolase